jgi:hypothetical protein
VTGLAVLYLAGVIVGLVFGDAQPFVRVAHALLWPLGIAAFVVTVGLLVAASLIAFPWIAGALVAASVILWAFGWAAR